MMQEKQLIVNNKNIETLRFFSGYTLGDCISEINDSGYIWNEKVRFMEDPDLEVDRDSDYLFYEESSMPVYEKQEETTVDEFKHEIHEGIKSMIEHIAEYAIKREKDIDHVEVYKDHKAFIMNEYSYSYNTTGILGTVQIVFKNIYTPESEGLKKMIRRKEEEARKEKEEFEKNRNNKINILEEYSKLSLKEFAQKENGGLNGVLEGLVNDYINTDILDNLFYEHESETNTTEHLLSEFLLGDPYIDFDDYLQTMILDNINSLVLKYGYNNFTLYDTKPVLEFEELDDGNYPIWVTLTVSFTKKMENKK